MKLALQPSLLPSLCWRQRMEVQPWWERSGAAGRSSESSLLLQKPQLSLKPRPVHSGPIASSPTCFYCLSKEARLFSKHPPSPAKAQLTADSDPLQSQWGRPERWDGLAWGFRGRQWQGGGPEHASPAPRWRALDYPRSRWQRLRKRSSGDWHRNAHGSLEPEATHAKWGLQSWVFWGLTNYFHLNLDWESKTTIFKSRISLSLDLKSIVFIRFLLSGPC